MACSNPARPQGDGNRAVLGGRSQVRRKARIHDGRRSAAVAPSMSHLIHFQILALLMCIVLCGSISCAAA